MIIFAISMTLRKIFDDDGFIFAAELRCQSESLRKIFF